MALGLPRPRFCACTSLARLPTEIARELFLDPFVKETALSLILLPTSRTCSMPRQDYFVPNYILPSHVKYYLNSQNFPPF